MSVETETPGALLASRNPRSSPKPPESSRLRTTGRSSARPSGPGLRYVPLIIGITAELQSQLDWWISGRLPGIVTPAATRTVRAPLRKSSPSTADCGSLPLRAAPAPPLRESPGAALREPSGLRAARSALQVRCAWPVDALRSGSVAALRSRMPHPSVPGADVLRSALPVRFALGLPMPSASLA
jgi:hypothetical protein